MPALRQALRPCCTEIARLSNPPYSSATFRQGATRSELLQIPQHFLERGFQCLAGCIDPLDAEAGGEAKVVLSEQVAGVGGGDEQGVARDGDGQDGVPLEECARDLQ